MPPRSPRTFWRLCRIWFRHFRIGVWLVVLAFVGAGLYLNQIGLPGFIKRPMPYLNFIGGGANSDVWSQILADVLGRKIRQVKDPITANARGAAFLVAISLGYITVDQISERIAIKKEYEPNPENKKIYDELYKEFVAFYQRNKKMYRRLNRAE